MSPNGDERWAAKSEVQHFGERFPRLQPQRRLPPPLKAGLHPATPRDTASARRSRRARAPQAMPARLHSHDVSSLPTPLTDGTAFPVARPARRKQRSPAWPASRPTLALIVARDPAQQTPIELSPLSEA